MPLYGDWAKAGVVLRAISTKLVPIAKLRLKENGELILDTLIEHIDKQDLNWTPLAERTIELKNGDDTIYVETGYLKDNLSVRKIKSSSDSVTYFVGASPWKVHKPSGEKFSDILLMLEYGTKNMPPRPLVAPTYEEVKDLVKKDMQNAIKEIVRESRW